MKPRRVIRNTLIAFFLISQLSCGSEIILPVIIGLSATWQDADDMDHRIEIRPIPASPDKSSGVFVGREFHDNNDDKNDNLLSGSYNGQDIEFTILRSNTQSEIRYTGKIITQNDVVIRMEFSSSEGELVLVSS